jgi:hypothetical protein
MPTVECRPSGEPKEASKCSTLGAVRRALLSCVWLFAVLEAAAMALYPGGTWWEPTALGHRFWQNFLCDLSWRVALNGQDNRVGSLLSQAAMLVLVGGFVPFWVLVGGAGARGVRILGLASVLGTAAVTLMPSDRFGSMHGVAVMLAATTGLAAAVLATVARLRARDRLRGGLGVAVLATSAVDFALYVRTFAGGGPGPLALPAIQKVALMLLLAWMVAVATPGSQGQGRSGG